MKIRILTFHRPHNFGAVFQAFALKTHLVNMGHDTKFFDYWPSYHEFDYPIHPCLENGISIKRRIINLIKYLPTLSSHLIRYFRFNRFIRHQLGVQGPYFGQSGLAQVTDSALPDLVIYGSDQIWRKHKLKTFNGFDPIYFGSGISKHIPKISYAASMGVIDVDDNDREWLRNSLAQLNFISVREKKLEQLVTSISPKPVTMVLDPVFLPNLSDWERLTHNQRVRKRPYILFYQLSKSNDAVNLVSRIKSNLSCDVIQIRGRIFSGFTEQNTLDAVGPLEFLSLVQNAKFVVSTSFHGVVFSLIFKKQFYALGMGNNSDRALTLLDSVSLDSRYLNSLEDLDLNSSIDYTKVTPLLNAQIDKSKQFLRESIEQILKSANQTPEIGAN